MEGIEKIWSVTEGSGNQIVFSGYIPTYTINLNTKYKDLFVASLSAEGEELWCYTEKNSADAANKVISTSDGNFLIAAQIIVVENNRKKKKITVRKINPNGNIIWKYDDEPNSYPIEKRTQGRYSFDIYNSSSAIETSDKNYIITGEAQGLPVWFKLSKNGVKMWQNKLYQNALFFQEIKESSDGSLFAVQSRNNDNSFLAKYYGNGVLCWLKKLNLKSYSYTLLYTLDFFSNGVLLGGMECDYSQYIMPRCNNFLSYINDKNQLKWRTTYAHGCITRIKTKEDTIMATTTSNGVCSFLKFVV